MNSTTAIPFTIDIPSSAVDDLRARLANTRWPEPLPGHPWQRGAPVGYVKELANYWLHGFDWPKQQTLLNRLPQFTTLVDGQTLHFLHIRSRERNARPLLLIHGWPGSFVEFLDLIGPLTDPRAHGGEPSDAFDLVIPSVPGHGFSRPLSGPGWTHGRCAAAYAKLMARLGYQHYGVHGGDVGAFQAPEVVGPTGSTSLGST